MATIQLIVVFTVVGLSAVFLYLANRSTRKVHSVGDYLSFGEVDERKLEKAFEGTNASFLTSFVSLFSFSLILGWSSLWIPIGFVVGIVFFNYFFLKKMIPHLINGVKYPELIGNNVENTKVRIFIGLFCAINIWLFTFSEIQGFHMFIAAFFDEHGIALAIIPIFLIVTIAIYTSTGGYRAVVDNDSVQVLFMYLMVVALFIFLFIGYFVSPQTGVPIKSVSVPFFRISDTPFVLSSLFGFLFSQILYYDNWQRLAYFLINRAKVENIDLSVSGEKRDQFIDDNIYKIVKNYNIASIVLFAIYLAPILLGIWAVEHSRVDLRLNSVSQLAQVFLNLDLSFDTIIGVSNFIICLFVFLGLFSALISTADTYLIAITSLICEDVLQIFKEKDRYRTGNKDTIQILRILRITTLIITVSLYPVLYIQPDFTYLFPFIFYSINGLAGPVIWILMQRKLRTISVILSIVFCFVYTYFSVYEGFLGDFRKNQIYDAILSPGTFNILFSFAFSYLGSKKI